MPQMANFVYNMYMHMIQSTRHYQQVRTFNYSKVCIQNKTYFGKQQGVLLWFETVTVIFKIQKGFKAESENIEISKILQ